MHYDEVKEASFLFTIFRLLQSVLQVTLFKSERNAEQYKHCHTVLESRSWLAHDHRVCYFQISSHKFKYR